MSTPTGLQFEHVSGCLTVRVSGPSQFQQRVSIAHAIVEALSKHAVNAMLIDLRNTDGPVTFMDRYQLGEMAAQYLPKIPLAALMREDQTDRQLIGQQVARNRGANLQVFTEEALAVAWLKEYAATSH